MNQYHLNQTLSKLNGPTREHISLNNQWAATGFDRYHKKSNAEIEFYIEGVSSRAYLEWDSDFSKATLKEDKDIANHGGVAMAWFVMSVLLDYTYVEQSEIGDGVDYRFMKVEPNDEELNFIDDSHFVEVSGILEESKTNTLDARLKKKHTQIDKGGKRGLASSVIITIFSQPKTIKVIHS